MKEKLNWKMKKFFSKKNPFFIVVTLLLTVILFVQATSNQNNNIVAKTKSTFVDGAWKAYFALQAVGGTVPCGEEMAIALEDLGRYIFSAQSAFLATLLPGTDQHVLPSEGTVNPKLHDAKAMTHLGAHYRIKNLLIGTFDGVYGKRWAISAEQAKELYKHVHSVIIDGVEQTALDYSNMFYDVLIATQLLIETTEEQALKIEVLEASNDQLLNRIEKLESALNISPKPKPNKSLNEVHINPTPSNNGIFNINYSINATTGNPAIVIKDVQGKIIYQENLALQLNGTHQLNLNLSAGVYFYQLTTENEQTTAKKLIIQ